MCYNSKNLFGCIGCRKKEYCILNRQYSKEEYEKLVPKIIEQMNTVPYIDQKGRIYKYGELFPEELSPFAYNETIAQEYFPKTELSLKELGCKYRKHEERNYIPTIHSNDLPDHIRDTSDEIINDIIHCPNDGNELTQCTKAYKVTSEELQFLRRHNIALPRYCPNCRHYDRLKQRNPLKLWHRRCMCGSVDSHQMTTDHDHQDQCPNEFETSYAPERPEKVFCEKCYQQEVI